MRNLNCSTEHRSTYPTAVFATVRQILPRSEARPAATTTFRVVAMEPVRDTTEAHALRALAANGFGAAAITRSGGYERLAGAALHAPARAFRARAVGDVCARLWRAVAGAARRAVAEWRRRELIRATYRTLRTLDDHTLRDLGFHPSELASVTAELYGRAALTRVRSAQARGC